MANTTGEKELKTDWPVVTGIDASVPDKLEGREKFLIPQEKSLVSLRVKEGL